MFKVKIEYNITTEEEKVIRKKENYLVNADSVTYAEAKILKDLPDNFKDKHVASVTSSTISEVIMSSGNKWFVFGVKFATDSTDKKGNTKYHYVPVMINGDDMDDAIKNLKSHYSNTVADYIISSVQETNIIIVESLLSSDVEV